MAVAVRYTEVGSWYDAGGNTQAVNPHSRFRIEMKTIGNAYKFSGMTDAQAESYLHNTIAKDGFWQEGDNLRPEVVRRDIHVNGYWTANRVNNHIVNYGGQSFHIWTRTRTGQRSGAAGKRDVPGVYQDYRADNKSLYWRVAGNQDIGAFGGGSAKGMFVLPWLSLNQR